MSGELFFLKAATRDQTLRNCDELEDLLPGQLTGPFYRRAKVQAVTSEGTFRAWAYVDPATPVDDAGHVLAPPEAGDARP